MVLTNLPQVDENKNTPLQSKGDISTAASSICREIGCLKGRYLWHKDDINAAKAILYNVYIQEMGWEFAKDNPTGLRVTSVDGKKILTDNLDSYAHWFGVFHNNKLISCIRLIEQNDKGNLDLTLYKQYQNTELQSKLDSYLHGNNTMELQRSATLKEYRKAGAMSIASSMAFEFAHLKHSNLLITSASKMVAEVMSDCKMTIISDRFDYGDSVLTYLLHGNSTILKNIEDNLNTMAYGLVKYQQFKT